MQEDDSNEKGWIVASIMNRIRDLKSKYKHEDNSTDELNFTKVSADTTGMKYFVGMNFQELRLQYYTRFPGNKPH